MVALSTGRAVFLCPDVINTAHISETSYAASATTLKERLTASDGSDYQFTVTYEESAGIPEDAELVISEIENKNDLNDYVDRSVDEITQSSDDAVDEVQFAKAFDIKLTDASTGEEYQPSEDVKVSIRLIDDDISESDKVGVVHFREEEGRSEDTPELLDTEVRDDSVQFETDGFSVYVVVGYTVDFHNGDNIFSISGGSEIFMSELIDALGITEFTLDDVKDVEFTDSELVRVDKVQVLDGEPEIVEDDKTEKVIEDIHDDWRLLSLEPFDTNETLYVTLKSGEVFEIPVTDERAAGSATSNASRVTAYGVTYTLSNRGTANGTATVYAIANGCKFYDEISYNGHVYKVNDITRTVGQLTSNKTDMDLDLAKRIAGYSFDLPDIKKNPGSETPTEAQGFVAGDNNSTARQQVWKKAEYNATTNSIDYTIKYFQAMKENVPVDFIFVYDDSASMYSGSRTSNSGVRLNEAEVTRVVILDAISALLPRGGASQKTGYDIKVYFGGASSGDNRASNAITTYEAAADYLADYHSGTTNHNTGVSNALIQARKSEAAGRNPVVIYISDFHQAGTLTNMTNVNALHSIAEVYALSSDYAYGTGAATRNIPTNEAHFRRMRAGDIASSVEEVEKVIKEAIGYYMKDQVTISDNLSNALRDKIPGEASATGGTATSAKGKNTWTIGGSASTLGAGRIYTETFSVSLDNDTVYAGATPTNSAASVSVGGAEVNKITPPSEATANLHFRRDLKFTLGKLNEKDNTSGQKKDDGTPLDSFRVAGIQFKLTKQGSSQVIGTYTTDSNGSFSIPYQNLNPGEKYVLEEVEQSVIDYNDGNGSDTDLEVPDSKWTITINDNGIVTSKANIPANQTPEMTTARPANEQSQLVIWNHIVIRPHLIPITVRKTWPDNVRADRQPDVPFKIYGVKDGNKYELTVYDSADSDASQVRYLSESTSTVSGNTWTRTVYVPDFIEENGEQIKFYDDIRFTAETLDAATDILKVIEKGSSSERTMTAEAIVEQYGVETDEGKRLICNQSYSYEISEGELVFEDGWYVPEYTNSNNPEAISNDVLIGDWTAGQAGHEGFVDYTGETSTDFQFRFNVFDFYYRGSDLSTFASDFGAYRSVLSTYSHINNATRMGYFYTRLKSIELTVTDTNDNNKQYKFTLTPGPNYTGDRSSWQYSAYGGVVFGNIKVPKSWESYTATGNQKRIQSLAISEIKVTSNNNHTFQLYPTGPNNNTYTYGPAQNNANYATQISRKGGVYDTSANHYYRNNTVTATGVQVYEIVKPVPSVEEGRYIISSCGLGIKNIWSENDLIELDLTKKWENSEGGVIPTAQQRESIEFELIGKSSAGEKGVKVFKDFGEDEEITWNNDRLIAGPGEKITMNGSKGASEWKDTYYVPRYDMSTFERTESGDEIEEFEYTMDETAMVAFDEPGKDGIAGTWKASEPIYKPTEEVHQEEAVIPAQYVEYNPESTKQAYLVLEIARAYYEGSWPVQTLHKTGIESIGQLRIEYTVGGKKYRDTIKLTKSTGENTIINDSTSSTRFFSIPFEISGSHQLPVSISKLELATLNGTTFSDWTSSNQLSSFNVRSTLKGTSVESRSTTREVWQEAVHIEEKDITIPATLEITNTFTPNKEVELSSRFIDATGDISSTRAIKKVYYTITARDGSVRTVFGDAVPTTGSLNAYATVAEKTVFVEPDTYTITQSYTLDNDAENAPARRYALDGNLDAYTVDWTERLDDGSETSRTSTWKYGATAINADRAITFTNSRIDLPIRVNITWEPSLLEGEDPINESGSALTYKIEYDNSSRQTVSIDSGEYIRTVGTSSAAKTGSFNLDKSRQINDHNTGEIPVFSVREMPTEVNLDSNNMKSVLPDYDLNVTPDDKTINNTLTRVFTIEASIKRGAILIDKKWDESVKDEDKEGVRLTFRIERSDGEDIYGTNLDHIDVSMNMPASDVPDITHGRMLLQDDGFTRYRSNLDSATTAKYGTNETIYLPILRSKGMDAGAKYIITEIAKQGSGQNEVDKKYYVSFIDQSGDKEANKFEETNPSGKNVDEGTRKANTAKFKLSDVGIMILIINSGDKGQEVAFMKIDSMDNPVNNATFTMYEDIDCTEESRVDPATSKRMNATVNGSKRNYNGIVFFGKVPVGIHYMEEDTPSGYAEDNDKYVVVVGEDYMDIDYLRETDANLFANVTQRDLDAQNDAQLESGMDDDEIKAAKKNYAIFRLDDGVAVTETDVTNYGYVNKLTASRKVIVRKTDSGYSPLNGARFKIYNYDMSEFDTTEASADSGVVYIGNLPYGRYYFKETAAPNGYGSNLNMFFRVDVNEEGATVSDTMSSPDRSKHVVKTDGTIEDPDPNIGEWVAVIEADTDSYEVGDVVNMTLTNTINNELYTISTKNNGAAFTITTRTAGQVSFGRNNEGITLLKRGSVTIRATITNSDVLVDTEGAPLDKETKSRLQGASASVSLKVN